MTDPFGLDDPDLGDSLFSDISKPLFEDEDDLFSSLAKPSSAQQKQLQRVSKLKKEAIDLGIDPSETEPRQSLVGDILNFIDLPKQAVLSVADGIFGRGDIAEEGLTGVLKRGFDERINAFDVLRRSGFENSTGRAIVGFGLEVGLDPLNLISFGAKNVAKGAGRALTEEGTEVLAKLRDPVFEGLDKGVKSIIDTDTLTPIRKKELTADIVDASGRNLKANEDRIFQTADKVTRIKKELGHEIKLSEKLGKETERAVELKGELLKEGNVLTKVSDQFDLGLDIDNVDKLFKDPTLTLGANLPFMGFLGKEAGERTKLVKQLEDEIGLTDEFSKARKARLKLGLKAGQVFNPLDLTKEVEVGQVLGSLGLNIDKLGDTYGNIRAAARATFQDVSKFADEVIAKAEDVPLVGSGVKLLTGGAKAANTLKNGAVEAFKHTFLAKTVYGKEGDEARREFLDQTATSHRNAVLQTHRTFQPEFKRLQDANNLKDPTKVKAAINAVDSDFEQSSLIIDRMADIYAEEVLNFKFDPKTKKFIGSNLTPDEEARFLDAINRAQNGEDTTETISGIFRAAEDRAFGPGKVEPDVGDLFGTVVPKESQLEAGTDIAAQRKLDFQANKEAKTEEYFQRALADVGERLGRTEGKLGEGVEDIARRALASFEELNEIEGFAGIKKGTFDYYIPHRYVNLSKQDGALAALGRTAGVDFTKKRKFASLEEAINSKGYIADLNIAKLHTERTRSSLNLRAEKAFFERLVYENAMSRSQVTMLAQQALKEGPESPAYKVLTNKGYSAPGGFNEIERFKETVAKELKESGELNQMTLLNTVAKAEPDIILSVQAAQGKVKNTKFANRLLGEMGDVVKVDGEEFILPPRLAGSLREMTKQKDFVKQAFGSVPGGDKLLGAIDTATGLAKLQTTVIWPAYWLRNVISDRFLGLMDTVHAMDPGLMAETLALQKGVGSIKTKTGQTISAEVFNQIRDQFGVAFNGNETVELASAYTKLDTDKFVKQQAFERVKKGELGQLRNTDTPAAFGALQNAFRDKFENAFRSHMLVHNLKRGDSLTDAVRGMSDSLIDYRNMSNAERSLLRRTYMFYGWLGGSTKRMLSSMMHNPSGITNQIRAAQGISEVFSDPLAEPTVEDAELKQLRSQAAMEGISFPLGKDKKGNTLVARGFGLPVETLLQSFSLFAPRNLSFQELQETFTASADRTLQKQFSQSNPIIKALAERTAQKNLYFNAPLDSAFLRKIPQLSDDAKTVASHPFTQIPAKGIDNITKTFLKAVPDGEGNFVADPFRMWLLVNVIPGMGRAVSTTRSLVDPSIPTVPGLLRATTGVVVDPGVDADRTLAFQQERALRELKVKRNLQLLKDQNKGLVLK